MTNTHSLFSIRRIYYRGKLASCNYACSYCPFGRKSHSSVSLEEDKQAWLRFITTIEHWKGEPLQLFIIPYGEALIHEYYRKGIKRLAMLPQVSGVSCQTNLSFPAEQWLNELSSSPATVDKIKVWASFHPEMTTVDKFVRQLHSLSHVGMQVCAGAVGNPSAKSLLSKLRDELSPDIYLFINAMQGLKTPLSEEDIEFFTQLDNLFEYDRKNAPAQWDACEGGRSSCFVDWKGDIYACPRSHVKIGNFYQSEKLDISLPCKRKVCDCYIAFSNLSHHPLHRIMGNGTFWRIPDKPLIRSAFFDIDRTLTDKQGIVPESYKSSLQYMAQKIPLYLATSLSVEQARKKLGKSLFSLFQGGVFAGGGLLSYSGQVECLQVDTLPDICEEVSKTTIYTYHGQVCKYSLLVVEKKLREKIWMELEKSSSYRLYRKGPLITIIHRDADKKEGVRRICTALQIPLEEAIVVGNSLEDEEMMSLVPHSCAVLNAHPLLKERACYVLNPDRLPAFFRFSAFRG